MKCRFCDDETRLYQKEWVNNGMYKAYFPICSYHELVLPCKAHKLPSYIPEMQDYRYLRQLEVKDKDNIYLKETGL
jgi:hypothetical protein